MILVILWNKSQFDQNGVYSVKWQNFSDSLLPYVKNVFSSPYLDTQTKLYFETYSSFRYMMILHFAPNFQKLHFCTTQNFGVKS